MQSLADQNVCDSGMSRQTTALKSEYPAKASSLLRRFLMALMRAFAVIAV